MNLLNLISVLLYLNLVQPVGETPLPLQDTHEEIDQIELSHHAQIEQVVNDIELYNQVLAAEQEAAEHLIIITWPDEN